MRRRSCFSVALLAMAVAVTAQSATEINGLDHVNVAVADLDAAAVRFRELGFSLKPGVPHANGIQNQHAKFPDGTEIELITAPSATDALTTTYRRYIAQGDAGAFLALFGRRSEATTATLKELQLAYVFFGPRNHSPTDRPEHFAHVNTADSLIGVWLAAADFSAERRLLQSSGATFVEQDVHVPETARATVARVPDGEIVFLPAARQVLPGRKIVGVTVRVRSLNAVRRVIADRLGQSLPNVPSARGVSVFIPPTLANGIWIEFREPA